MPNTESLSDLRDHSLNAALVFAAGLAAEMLNTCAAAIGIRGNQDRWTTISHGLGRDWDIRELPFFADLLTTEKVLVHSGPVPGLPSIRFAAGIPLRRGSKTIGVLAVLGPLERALASSETIALRQVAVVARDAALKALGLETGAGASQSSERLDLQLDLSGRIVRVEPETEHRLGYGPGALIGRNLADLAESGEQGSAMDGFLAQLGSGGGLATNLRLIAASGERILVRAHTRLAFERGVPVAVNVSLQDISSEAVRLEALQQAEQALTAKAEELARFSEHLRQLHRLATAEYFTIDELLDDYLGSGCEILRMPVGLIVSFTASTGDEHPRRGQIRAAYPREDPTRGMAAKCGENALHLAMQGTFTYPFDMPGESEQLFGYASSISTPIYTGEELFGLLSFCSEQPGDVRRFTAHEREILELMAKSLGRSIYEDMLRRERTRLTLELARQAQQDPLTSLSNRLKFMNSLEISLQKAAAARHSLAVAFLDLDRFKQINDTLGHAVGDEMLRQVASRIASEVGVEDEVARVGGDEFTIVFRGNPSRARVSDAATHLLDALRAPYVVEESELFITASMGISFFPEDARDARNLLQKADAAMYRAKNQGKNEFRFFTPDIIVRGSNRLELETQLRRALEKGELGLGFQPLVSMNGTLDSLEALLAWNNSRFGRVGASKFIPIAEESGMIIPIGAWVLHEVCRQVTDWQRRGVPLIRVAINVSTLQFARPDFVETVAQALIETGMPPQCLELELTESIIMRDVESSARRMAELREVGVSISIDDFGTGYSSLSYLRRLPVDALKIDQSFTGELNSSGTSLPLIQTIVILAHNMGLAVVAEGVETREQLELLRAIGCDKVQGHLFGGPLTIESAEQLMRRPSRDVPIAR